MWWAWGEELAVFVEPQRVRWRHFDRRFRPDQYKGSISQVSVEEGQTTDSLGIELARTTNRKGLRGRAYISEDLCDIGWVRASAQRLTAEEIKALVQLKVVNVQPDLAGCVTEVDVLRHGYLYACIASRVLATVQKLVEDAGARLTSARPALAPVVSDWLRRPTMQSTPRRSLLVLGTRTNYAFSAENGELVDAARYRAAPHHSDIGARLSALRISLGWPADSHDVIVGPDFKPSHDRNTATSSPRNFSDLYAIAPVE